MSQTLIISGALNLIAAPSLSDAHTPIKSRARQLSQGMTEYIIIVTLIATSAIVVYNLFGSTVREPVGDMAVGSDGKLTHPAD